jgi:hypothetical protein
MNRFYFTFGLDRQIYRGGWVVIHANTLEEAQNKFVKRFAERAVDKKGYLCYAFSYRQDEFEKTKMHKKGNFGAYCHEEIL